MVILSVLLWHIGRSLQHSRKYGLSPSLNVLELVAPCMSWAWSLD